MEAIQKIVEAMTALIQEGKPGEEVSTLLVSFLRGQPAAARQVIEKMAGIPHETTIRILQDLIREIPDKKIHKIIKRVLYRLKAKGVPLTEMSPGGGTSVLKPPEAEPPTGYGTGIDPIGHRLFLLVIPHRGRGVTVLQGVMSDREGVIQFTGQEMTRKEAKAFMTLFLEERDFPVVEMEAPYVAFLFFRAYQLTLEKKKLPPPDFLQFKGEIERLKINYERPLIYSCFLPGAMEGDAAGSVGSNDLLSTDLLSSWEIEESFLRPFADSILEARGSKLFLNQGQREARFQEIYLDAVRELYSNGFQLLYQQRLEETAYVLMKLGREEEKRGALAAASDLQKPWNSLQPNPFLQQLVIRSINRLLAEGEEKKRQESSMILAP